MGSNRGLRQRFRVSVCATAMTVLPLAAVVAWAPVTAWTPVAQGGVVPTGSQTRTISITITDSGFNPSHVVSLLNQPLTFKVVNRGHHVHEFSIPDYYIFSQNLAPGASTSAGFTPNKPGQFVMMSDPKGTDQPEFQGKLTITEAK